MRYLFTFLILAILILACKKEEYKNPYDDIPPFVEQDTTAIELDPTTIQGLHANIFSKTCANSGCHDGTFEPDFRTIESSYNTLVNHPIIKNDPQESYEFRVVKGDVNASQLVARLEIDIDGQSGIMPLVVDPDSDWNEKKTEYIQNIKDWIANGAKDVFGN